MTMQNNERQDVFLQTLAAILIRSFLSQAYHPELLSVGYGLEVEISTKTFYLMPTDKSELSQAGGEDDLRQERRRRR